MADEDGRDGDGREVSTKRDGAGLSRDVQEHLGRRLRTALRVQEAKPSFLGETSLPPEFERIVRRLEAGERGQRQGYEAVKAALGDLGDLAPGKDKPKRS